MLSELASLRSSRAIQRVGVVAALGFFWLSVTYFLGYDGFPFAATPSTFSSDASSTGRPSADVFDAIEKGAKYFLAHPLQPPYKDVFGELGERAKVMRSWIEALDVKRAPYDEKDEDVRIARGKAADTIDRVAESLFSYLKTPSGSPHALSPLTAIRHRILDTKQSNDAPKAGIVIPTGDHTLRYSCHLLAALTRVHKTKLPIQIVYAGKDDLSPDGKASLEKAADGADIEFVDIKDVFNDEELKLAEGGWAIKPFAALASSFDQVILLDADTVFFQDPARLLEQKAFADKGALLFHDRLLWKNGFKERQDWWHEQIKNPTPETNKSLVWTERYSEEGDSGLVVLDKTRLDVLIGLLHIGWQNSFAVRDQWTYKVTYGDKETWWIGFEATASRYTFSRHYGGMVGWLGYPPEEEDKKDVPEEDKKKGVKRVCSFVIAHVDEDEKLLWYNGGLLKNKLANFTHFEVPTHWMIDDEWQKGNKKTMSCMVGKEAHEIPETEKKTIGQCIDVAKDVDERFHLVPAEE